MILKKICVIYILLLLTISWLINLLLLRLTSCIILTCCLKVISLFIVFLLTLVWLLTWWIIKYWQKSCVWPMFLLLLLHELFHISLTGCKWWHFSRNYPLWRKLIRLWYVIHHAYQRFKNHIIWIICWYTPTTVLCLSWNVCCFCWRCNGQLREMV
jgi:hypothetical protein